MQEIRALISYIASVDDDFRQDHLKLCALWYDEVLYEYIGRNSESDYLSRLTKGELGSSDIHDLSDIIMPVDKRISSELSKQFKELDTRGYPRWGKDWKNYTYPDPQTAEEYAHNILLKHIKNERGPLEGIVVEHAEGRARVAVDAVSMWKSVNEEVSCMLQSTSDEKLAMSAASIFGAPPNSPKEAYKLFELSVPSLTCISWKEIIKLKRQGNFARLRNELERITSSSTGNLDHAQRLLAEAETKATEEIIDRFRPNVRVVIAEALWSNIPNIPFLNPVGAYFSGKNVRNEFTKAKGFEWYYLLRDIKNLSSVNGNNS